MATGLITAGMSALEMVKGTRHEWLNFRQYDFSVLFRHLPILTAALHFPGSYLPAVRSAWNVRLVTSDVACYRETFRLKRLPEP